MSATSAIAGAVHLLLEDTFLMLAGRAFVCPMRSWQLMMMSDLRFRGWYSVIQPQTLNMSV